MSCLCPGKEAEMVSDDFIAVSDVTETVVFETEGQRIVYVDNPDTSREAGDVTITRIGLALGPFDLADDAADAAPTVAGGPAEVLEAADSLPANRCQHRIMAELVMVVEVLIPSSGLSTKLRLVEPWASVAQRNADNSLHYQRLDRMLGVGEMAAVLEAGCQTPSQAQHPVCRPQQQGTGVAGVAPPANEATTARPSARAKSDRSGLHSVGIGGLLCSAKVLLQKNFRRSGGPMHLPLVTDTG